MSRHGVDHTRRVADIAAAIAKLSARKLAFDGEVAIYDQQLRSRFECELDQTVVATPPVLLAFDQLYFKSRDVRQRPLRDHRARLEDVVATRELVFPVRLLAPDGQEAWKQVVERGTRATWPRTTPARARAGARRGT